MIVDRGSDHQFVGAGLLDEFFQSGADGLWRADEGASQHVGDVRFFHRRPVRLNVINGRRKLAARAAHGIGKALLGGSKQTLRFGIGIGSNYVHADHGIRLLELRRWPKFSAVSLERQQQCIGREVRCESIRQAEFCGKLRAKKTGAENPDWDIHAGARNCLDCLSGLKRTEKCLQFTNVIGETIGAGRIAAKGAQCSLIGAGSATKPEIDAPRIERFKRAKLFRDNDRRMVRQHDSARAHANGFGASGNISDDDRSSSAGNADHVVVLGQPETPIPPALSVLRQIERMVQGVRRGGSLRDECKIKNGERDQKIPWVMQTILMLRELLEVHNLRAVRLLRGRSSAHSLIGSLQSNAGSLWLRHLSYRSILSWRWRSCPIPAHWLVHADKHAGQRRKMDVFSIGSYHVASAGKCANSQTLDRAAETPPRWPLQSCWNICRIGPDRFGLR